MTLKELIDKTTEILGNGLHEGVVSNSDYNTLTVAWNRLKNWVYPQLAIEDVQKVTHCKDCKHYKRYRKKDCPKLASFYACSLTKIKRNPDFFCKDGAEK